MSTSWNHLRERRLRASPTFVVTCRFDAKWLTIWPVWSLLKSISEVFRHHFRSKAGLSSCRDGVQCLEIPESLPCQIHACHCSSPRLSPERPCEWRRYSKEISPLCAPPNPSPRVPRASLGRRLLRLAPRAQKACRLGPHHRSAVDIFRYSAARGFNQACTCVL